MAAGGFAAAAAHDLTFTWARRKWRLLEPGLSCKIFQSTPVVNEHSGSGQLARGALPSGFREGGPVTNARTFGGINVVHTRHGVGLTASDTVPTRWPLTRTAVHGGCSHRGPLCIGHKLPSLATSFIASLVPLLPNPSVRGLKGGAGFTIAAHRLHAPHEGLRARTTGRLQVHFSVCAWGQAKETSNELRERRRARGGRGSATAPLC